MDWRRFWGLPVLCAVALLPSQRAIAAGAAYQVDTAEISEPGSCKVESWASFAANRDFIASVAPACVVNLYRAVEVSAQFNRTRSDDEWGTAVTPKLKTQLKPGSIGSWAVAVTATSSYDLLTGENMFFGEFRHSGHTGKARLAIRRAAPESPSSTPSPRPAMVSMMGLICSRACTDFIA